MFVTLRSRTTSSFGTTTAYSRSADGSPGLARPSTQISLMTADLR